MTSPLIFGDWHGQTAYAETQRLRAHNDFPHARRGGGGAWSVLLAGVDEDLQK